MSRKADCCDNARWRFSSVARRPTQLTAGVAVLAPGFQGAGSLAVGGGFASAAVATGGALAVLCVALCPSPIGQDLPIFNNQQGPKEILTPGGVPIWYGKRK
jgi:hypothetical protein